MSITDHKYFWIGLILIFAAIPRFALINVNKAAWWDETQYLLMTKHLLTGSPTTGWWEGRSIFYPLLLAALSFPIGFNELWVRIINVLFSLGFIFMTYKLIRLLYSERYALAAALITSAQWVFFFYSFRILLGIPSAFFLATSSYYFIKSINKDFKQNLLSGLLLGIAFDIRFTSGVLILVYFAYLLLTKNFKYKNYFWLLGFILGFSILGVYELVMYGNPLHSALEFLKFNLESSGGAQQGGPLYYITTMFFNYGIIMGLTIWLGLLGLVLKANKKNNLFVLLNLTVFLSFYSLITQVKEFRFLIHLLPFLSVTSVIGIALICNVFSKKHLTIFLVSLSILIVLENSINGYQRVQLSAGSYEDVKLAGEYLSQLPAENIISASQPQITYYSGKNTYNFPENETAFYELIANKSIKYVMASIYEHHPDYAYNLSQPVFAPIKAYPNPANPRAIIYYVNESQITKQ